MLDAPVTTLQMALATIHTPPPRPRRPFEPGLDIPPKRPAGFSRTQSLPCRTQLPEGRDCVTGLLLRAITQHLEHAPPMGT